MSTAYAAVKHNFAEVDGDELVEAAVLTIHEEEGAHVFRSTRIKEVVADILEAARAGPKRRTYEGLVMALSFCIYHDRQTRR